MKREAPRPSASLRKHLTPAEMDEYLSAQRKVSDLRRELQPAQRTVRRLKDLARKRAGHREN